MIAVDSSVWIDFFNGRGGIGVERLRALLVDGAVELVVPDLVLFEVLRGFRGDRERRQAHSLLEGLSVRPTCDPALAVAAADHWRALRASGISVRSSIDTLVAAFCIRSDLWLLHGDRDYSAFEPRGLRVWRGARG